MTNKRQYFYDLHIHSCLSPCADEDMTPNQIVNRAIMCGLQMIAVSDHNTCGNVKAVMEAGKKQGLLVIPAMELETSEEVHVLCYFSELSGALEFEEMVRSTFKPMNNRPEIFGKQLIVDSEDRVTGTEEKMLLTATGISIAQVSAFVKECKGAAVPAHIDRNSFSVLSNLGFISREYGFGCVEISERCDINSLTKAYPEVAAYQQIINSDAHNIRSIARAGGKMELNELAQRDIIDKLLRL